MAGALFVKREVEHHEYRSEESKCAGLRNDRDVGRIADPGGEELSRPIGSEAVNRAA